MSKSIATEKEKEYKHWTAIVIVHRKGSTHSSSGWGQLQLNSAKFAFTTLLFYYLQTAISQKLQKTMIFMVLIIIVKKALKMEVFYIFCSSSIRKKIRLYIYVGHSLSFLFYCCNLLSSPVRQCSVSREWTTTNTAIIRHPLIFACLLITDV